MKKANEMRTLANNYNAQFEINNADDVINRVIEEDVLKAAKSGNYEVKLAAEKFAVAIRGGMHYGNEIVTKAKYNEILARAKELAEMDEYEVEVIGDFHIIVKW